jgi:tetratricopeptide (TPR) repeat protein
VDKAQLGILDKSVLTIAIMNLSIKQIRTTFFIAFVFTSLFMQGQGKVNYIRERNSYVLASCGQTSVEMTKETLRNLESLSPEMIAKGLFQYFYDKGMANYSISILENPPADFTKAIACFNECIQLKKRAAAPYYNLAVMYDTQKQYSKAYDCLQNYKKYEKRKNRDNDEVLGFEKSLKELMQLIVR